MRRTQCWFFSIIVVAILSGCVYGSGVPIGSDHYTPTSSQKVIILTESPDPSTYKVVGTVRASGAPAASKESVYSKLQKYAADLGSDAVIVTEASRGHRANTDFGPMYGWDVAGMAIKYIK